MRADALGLFWEDRPPPPKEKAEKARRTPPDPVWLRPDYLPGLEEALRFPVLVMSNSELVQASMIRDRFVFDIECYINYFIASFRSVATGKAVFFEMYEGHPLDVGKLRWVLENITTVGFNSLSYDLPITLLALAGKPNALLKHATNQIINEGWRGSDVLKQYKVKGVKIDHIDLIEVAPLRASLKIYGGRLHVPRMQDLPFHPDTVLSPEQIACVRWYNINSDLTSTAFLHECLKEHIDLRTTLSNETGIDLRSKSDAQIAEAVLGEELRRRTGRRPEKPVIEVGTAYRYRVPNFIRYQSQLMNWALSVVANSNFLVDETGSIGMPEEIKALQLDINGSVYRMGIGGLHSSESTAAHHSDDDYVLIDRDVTSYYPFIILILGLFPPHLGPIFLDIYRGIVDRRISAKQGASKLKELLKQEGLEHSIKIEYNHKLETLSVIADSLKITINGSFGKLGSKYSILYAPDLLIQVTVTGQLSLLMLIERLELAGIHVVSANTDGIVIKCPRKGQHVMDQIIAQWEQDTGFQTEGTIYKSLYSRDVNNYIAVKEDGSTKCKGAYANPWASKKNMAERLHKNPTNTICVEAVEALLTKNIPIMTTVRRCKDITKFVSVRSVKGGAVKVWDRIPPPAHSSQEELLKLAGFVPFSKDSWVREGDTIGRAAMNTERAYKAAWDELSKPGLTEYLGKSIRWYYAVGVQGEIVYATNGNKVPRSEGAKPMMDLPDEFPADVDFEWYEQECEKILQAIGYSSKA